MQSRFKLNWSSWGVVVGCQCHASIDRTALHAAANAMQSGADRPSPHCLFHGTNLIEGASLASFQFKVEAGPALLSDLSPQHCRHPRPSSVYLSFLAHSPLHFQIEEALELHKFKSIEPEKSSIELAHRKEEEWKRKHDNVRKEAACRRCGFPHLDN